MLKLGQRRYRLLSAKGDVERATAAACGVADLREAHADLFTRVGGLQEEVSATIRTRAAAPLAQRALTAGAVHDALRHALQHVGPPVGALALWSEHHLPRGEVAYRCRDHHTPGTGRLVKLVMIQDATGMSPAVVARARALAANQGRLS